MKRILILITLLLTLPVAAQEAYTKGKIFIDAQIGDGTLGRIIGGGVHYGITPQFSVGAQFYNQDFGGEYKYIESYLPQLSADYHFGLRKTVDWYIGLSGGYVIWHSNDPYNGVKNTGCLRVAPEVDLAFRNNHKGNAIMWNAHFGARIFVYKWIALHAELGLGNVIAVKLGVSVRI